MSKRRLAVEAARGDNVEVGGHLRGKSVAGDDEVLASRREGVDLVGQGVAGEDGAPTGDTDAVEQAQAMVHRRRLLARPEHLRGEVVDAALNRVGLRAADRPAGAVDG